MSSESAIDIKGEGVLQKARRDVVVDGRRAPWLVKTQKGLHPGDVVKLVNGVGSSPYARLREQVPFLSPNEMDRWSFESVTKLGEADAHEKARQAKQASQQRHAAEDGYPSWWSRRLDTGRVMWPAQGDSWRDRDSGEVGVVLVDQRGGRVGWYEVDENGRRDAKSGYWLRRGEFMDEFEFVSREYRKRECPEVVSGQRPD